MVIKSYTDVSQSRKLAKILPLESADMYYSDVPVREWVDKTDISKGTHVVFKSQIFALENLPNSQIGEEDTYAWSLAALINVLPRIDIEKEIFSDNTFNYRVKAYIGDGYIGDWFDNPVDACVAMIENLHERKML